MSHSQGRVKFPSGNIGYLEYNGTTDVMLPNIYETEEELLKNWRKQNWKSCSNKQHTHIDVEIATSYGDGFYWKSKACVECNCLIDNLMPFEDSIREEKQLYTHGIPEWWPRREKYL